MSRRIKFFEKVEIIDLGARGKGVGKINGKTVFVDRVIPGDVVDVKLIKSNRNFAEGKATFFHQKSKDRQDAFCQHFGTCGGCKWQYLDYDKQLEFKQNIVDQAFQRIGHIDIKEQLPILGAVEQRYYRNKLEFTFTAKRWLEKEEIEKGEEIEEMRGLGFNVPGQFSKVVNIEKCYLQADPSNTIRNALIEFVRQENISCFHLNMKQGMMRNVVIRSTTLGELMVIVVFGEPEQGIIQKVMNFLKDKFPEITSLNYMINEKLNDATFDLEVHHFSGNEHIVEELNGLKFKISPKSFFQTNSRQAAVLYQRVMDLAQLQGDEVVYDLYTGTGSIALSLARSAKHVIGVEQIPEAIADAWENAKLNDIENVHFESGLARKVLTKEFIQKHGQADVVVTDPPRNGMHPDVVQAILDLNPEKVVYVSCNPATQARDVQLMAEQYDVVISQAVDMFPHTPHIENIALLIRKDN